MSAEVFLAFYGICRKLREDEIESLELEEHPIVELAQKNGLEYYWGDFATPEERYLLFVGDQLGVLGWENSSEVIIKREDLLQRIADTEKKLRLAGFNEKPALYLQHEPTS